MQIDRICALSCYINNDPAQLKISKLIGYLEEVVPKISNQKPLGKQIDGEGEMVFRKK